MKYYLNLVGGIISVINTDEAFLSSSRSIDISLALAIRVMLLVKSYSADISHRCTVCIICHEIDAFWHSLREKECSKHHRQISLRLASPTWYLFNEIATLPDLIITKVLTLET